MTSREKDRDRVQWRAGEPLGIISTPSCLTADPGTWQVWIDRNECDIPSEWYVYLYNSMLDKVSYLWIEDGPAVDIDNTHWMPAEGLHALNKCPAKPIPENP